MSAPPTTQQQLQQLLNNSDFDEDQEEEGNVAQQQQSTADPGHQFDAAVLGVGFGHVQYSIEERQFLHNELQQKLEVDMISKRDGPSGGKVHYIETWKAIAQTNRIFGFNGWSSRIMDINLDFIDQTPGTGRFTAGVSAVVRITLKDGTHREDIGYGISENQKQKGKALDQAKKKAVSDALKRALKGFGHALGLSVYDKEHIKDVERLARIKVPNKNGDSGQKPLNPHFNQTPGSPPRNSFAPMASPQQQTPASGPSNLKIQKSSPPLKSESSPPTFQQRPPITNTGGSTAANGGIPNPRFVPKTSPQQQQQSGNSIQNRMNSSPQQQQQQQPGNGIPPNQPISQQPPPQQQQGMANAGPNRAMSNQQMPQQQQHFTPQPNFRPPSFTSQQPPQQQQQQQQQQQPPQQGVKRPFTAPNLNNMAQKRAKLE